MPQPLSRVHSNPSVTVSSGAIANSPDCARLVMRVIADWAHIDGDISTILTTLLGADVAVGAAMYQALTGGDARRAALLGAAQKALPPWKYILLQAVLKATKPSRDERNDFAHHVWGNVKEIPDALLLMHPHVVLEMNVSHREVRYEGNQGVITPKGLDTSKIMVYYHADFATAVVRSSNATMMFVHLYWAL